MDNLLQLCDYYQTDIYELLEEVSNVNFTGAKFKGSSYLINPNNSTITYATSPELLQNLINNQQNMTVLIQQQNELISKLLDKK